MVESPSRNTSPRRSRKERARLRWTRRAVNLTILLLLTTAVPVVAVAPPGSLDVPDPPDWGVLEGLRGTQENETGALDDPAVVAEATSVLEEIQILDYAREPATGPFDLHSSIPPPIQELELLPTISESPYGNLTNFLAILLDQPLMVFVMVRSGEHVNWAEVRLSVDFPISLPLGILKSIREQWQWASVDVDNDTTTGDAAGNDLRLRIYPVMQYKDREITPFPPEVRLEMRGGIAIELERLGSDSEELPIDTTFIKSFRYNTINYTWFLEYKVDAIPEHAQLSLTAEQLNLTIGGGQALEMLRDFPNITIDPMSLANISGPYTIANQVDDDLQRVQASLGYIKLASVGPAEDPEIESASWLTVRVSRTAKELYCPRQFSLWLDSPSFNRSFDHLNWTADKPSVLELEYYDDRENYTQAKGQIRDIPRNLRLKIDNVTEEVGPVSKVHLTSSEPVDLLRFDEWEFMGTSRSKYLHSHVELEDIPTEFWLNGTLEIGGKAFDPLDPDPTVRSIVPMLMDAMMTRLTSKLFTIGKTIRSVPLNILNMPDRAGYTSIELPNPEDYLGKLEIWLTSDHYVLVEEGTDFFAFYNDSVTPVGHMVQTGFSARLMDIKSFHANFDDDKLVTLDSRYNRELRALFIDPKNQANASLWFSNIPHNITLHLMDEELMYLGDGTVDRIQYTSEIGEQYMRLVLEGVPGGIRIHQGEETSGVVALIGEIDSLDIQVTVGRVKRMQDDHLLVVMDSEGATAASAHITGLRSLLYTRTPTNHITLSSGGKPFKVYMSDAIHEFELRAMLDPLPATLEADVSDVLGMGNISVPTLNDLTSVLDFASIIYAISDLGEDIINALGDLSSTLVEGLGTFSSDFDFEFNGNIQMDLVATVSRMGGTEVEPVPWAHGVTARMVPHGGEVLLDAKVFLTGVAPQGNLRLMANERATNLTMGLTGFTPRYDTFVLSIDGASRVAGSGGKDIWLFLTGLGTHLDLELELDVFADMSIGGTSKGGVVLKASHDLGPLHMRVRTLEDSYATIELLLSSVPATADVSFEYSSDISLRSILPRSVDYLFLKISRDLQEGMAPASTVTFHDVPRQMEFFTGSAGTYDMDSPSPVHNLPQVTVDTNEPGLDVLVDLVGRSMGNKADLHLDARDVQGMFMTHTGEEYRISAEKLAFLHMSMRNLVFSDTVWINRIDLAGEDLSRVTVKVPMVFGVYPLFDISDMVAGGLQVSLDIDISFGDTKHHAHINLFEVPMSLSGLPRSHSNGVAMREADEVHRLFVPAPMSTVIGTLLD